MFIKFLSKSISVKFFISPPRIKGITIKNENLAAVFFSTPKKIAKAMVEPLLDRPGKIANA